MIKRDEKSNFLFEAISLYVGNNISDWLLKTVDPEFIKGVKAYRSTNTNKLTLLKIK
jgi:hypothetical protein